MSHCANWGGGLIYSKVWRRMAALCVDFIILSPLFVISIVGDGNFRLFKIYWFLPVNILCYFYYVYLPYRFGGTPGKRILGLRMLRVNGEPLKYREVILRFLIFWLPGLGVSVAGMMAVWSLTDAQYFSAASALGRSHLVTMAMPSWYNPLTVVWGMFLWVDWGAMLMNKKRRALHDFIAGTVVVRDIPHGSGVSPGNARERDVA